jgi:hypothetical protein
LIISRQAFSSSNIDLLSYALGAYDINDDQEAADIRFEYRFGRPLILDFKPWLGAEITTKGGLYGAGGILYDWQVIDNFYIVPSIGAGLYSDGGGKDLGHTLQFRTQLEIQYELEDNSRFSLAYSHISNASLSDRNPGAEIFSLYYHMPLEWVF